MLSIWIFRNRLGEGALQVYASRFVGSIFSRHTLLVDAREKDRYARLWELSDAEEVGSVDLTVVAMGGFKHIQSVFVRVVACAVDILPEA